MYCEAELNVWPGCDATLQKAVGAPPKGTETQPCPLGGSWRLSFTGSPTGMVLF